MSNVAIIGKDSYIGSHIASLLKEKGYNVTEVEAINNKWAEFDFTTVDTVIHVAAIVHRRDIADYDIYNEVNVKLPLDVAKQAMESGVKQFVFMSSMAVYGKGHVLKNCAVQPGDKLYASTGYAKSKLEAETELHKLIGDKMILSIVRPPSVYGKGCKGNLFDRYYKIAGMLPVIPECEPDCLQGVVHIDNLATAVYSIINGRTAGCFHPQDSELLSTGELLNEIRKYQSKKSKLSRTLGKLGSVFSFVSVYKKLFGAVYYSPRFSETESYSGAMITTREGLRRMYNEKENSDFNS